MKHELVINDLSILPLPFYKQSTIQVAQELLGKYLVFCTDNSLKVGKISETEAYPGINDRASHSHRMKTQRTAILFGPAGMIYVYMIYGMYYCLNVVTDTPESGGAVLIRAVEPVRGIDKKTTGPGLVCKAYGIDKTFNGLAITEGPLTIRQHTHESELRFETLPRIGVDYAGEDSKKLYRFKIAS